MKSKSSKIKYIVWACEIAFSCFILLFLFFIQIVLLNKYYEVYKTRILDNAANTIKTNEDITVSTLEDIAFNNGICISIYQNNEINIVSNIYNKGCAMEESSTIRNYISSFINSDEEEDSLLITGMRFKNKTLVKAIKLDEGTYVFLSSSIEALDSSIELLKSQYVYISVIILLLSILVGYFISSQISKPISLITDSAKKMADGDFSVSFKSDSKIYEIAELSETLEKAKAELSRTDELRRDLLANVGHDLKTPLTMIKAYAEMTRDLKSQTKEKKDENLNVIIEETDRLTVLVNDILDLSKIQAKTSVLKIEEFDLTKLINNIIKRYDILVQKEDYKFIFNTEKTIMVKADKIRIEQVIYNLINNAVNYTGDSKEVFINVIELEKSIRVEIKDTGKGIKKEEIKYIWDKYYHNQKKHKRNAYGTGLGLSIVKNILEQHNFKYGVDSVIDKGTTFYFEINK